MLNLDPYKADSDAYRAAKPGGEKAWLARQLAAGVPDLLAEVERLQKWGPDGTGTAAAEEIQELAAELAEERTQHQQTMAELERVRAAAYAHAIDIVKSADIEGSNPTTVAAFNAWRKSLVAGLRIGEKITRPGGVADPLRPPISVTAADAAPSNFAETTAAIVRLMRHDHSTAGPPSSTAEKGT